MKKTIINHYLLDFRDFPRLEDKSQNIAQAFACAFNKMNRNFNLLYFSNSLRSQNYFKRPLVFLGVLLLSFISTSIFAQFTISGTVSENGNSETMIGANVLLKGTSIGNVTNADGFYRFKVEKGGSYTLTVSYVGYKTIEKQLDLKSDLTIDFALEADVKMLDSYKVYGTKLYPVTKTSVDKADLEKVNLGQDLPILLNFTPSIVTTSDAGAGIGYTGFRIRGSDPQRINVTVNGIPMNDSESHGVFWVNMPDFASSVESITIQRGVGTSTNGAAAFGASVDLTTKSPSDEAFVEYNGSYGSFNTWKNSVQFGTGKINDKLSITGRLSKLTTDGFIDNAFVDLKSFYLSGEYESKVGTFTANIFSGKEITFQAWNGVSQDQIDAGNRTFNELAGYDNETDNYQQDHYQLLYNKQLNPNWKVNGAFHYTKGRGYFEQYKSDRDFSDYGLENPNLTDSDGNPISETDVIVRRWLDNDFYGVVGSVNYNKDKLDVVLGGGLNKYEGAHFGEVIWAEYSPTNSIRNRYYENDADKTDWNIYGKATYELTEGLFSFLDLQVRQIEYDFIGSFDFGSNDIRQLPRTDKLTFFNPKAGLKYYKGNHEFYGSYAIANKEPNRDDYVSSSQNSIPEHETLRNLELGWIVRFDNSMVGVNIYHMDYDNQLILTGAINDVGAGIRQNIAESYRLGIELQAEVQLTNEIKWQGNATFSENKIKNYSEFLTVYDDAFNDLGLSEIKYDETDIAFSPSVIIGNQLTFSLAEGLEAGLMMKHVGKQYLDNTKSEDRKIDSYSTLDFRCAYTFSKGMFKNVTFSLLANNILSYEYSSNGYTYGWLNQQTPQDVIGRTSVNYYYPQAGANVLFAMKLRI
jgi:iron complex outermembrane receptor protein